VSQSAAGGDVIRLIGVRETPLSFDDVYSAGGGAAPERRAGPHRPQPPEGVQVFGGLGVHSVFAGRGGELFGAAVFTPGYVDSGFRGRPRLIVARVRP
jgi:hypothetical protein